MSAWYKKLFGRPYLDLYAHRDQKEAEREVRTIISFLGLDKEHTLLDLCCGAGRHLLALYRAGYKNLYGLDLSEELLEVASRRLFRAGASHITFLHSDMRHIPYKCFFNTVISLFTSFGYFESDEENRKVFEAVFLSLRKGGVFLLDYINKQYVLDNLVKNDTWKLNGKKVKNERNISGNKKFIRKIITVITGDGKEQVFNEEVRLYSSREISAMLGSTGFTDIRAYGSLDGETLSDDSKRLVITCRKK
ncbi:class I SAM-dependent methyltransferase [Spirochaetota bacterium]